MPKQCESDGCFGSVHARGLCMKHYLRMWRGRPVDDALTRRVSPDASVGGIMGNVVVCADGCWNWRGYLNSKGYGRVGRHNAHRWLYMELNGSLEPWQYVCHRCDNPACVNPAHMFVGTHADNMRDMVNKGRRRRVTKAGEDA